MPVIDAFGARWTFDVSGLDDELAAELLRLWDRTLVAPDGIDGSAVDEPPPFVVRRTESGLLEIDGNARPVAGPDVPYAVSRSLTLASIRRRTGSCLMLHAAGLATEDGGTVALVASSGTGKTTAGRLLGRSLGYVTDETVTIEHDLTVRAYPKPLSLVVDPQAPSAKHEQSPDELTLRRAPAALHLSAVAVLERRADAAMPTLTPIGLVEAMETVLPQTSALPSLDRPLDRLARALTSGHGPYRLVYRDIADCLELVSDLAHQRDLPADDVTWTWFDGTGHEGGPTPVPDDLGLATVVCRTAFRDAVLSDGVVLVLRGLSPVTLPGLAATLWLAAEQPCTVSDLLVAATAELGPHPGAVSIVLDTVRALLKDRALRVV